MKLKIHKNVNTMRKTIQLLAVLTLSLVLTSCNSQSKNKEEQSIDKTISKIEVIDFHSTHRCMTCNAIEANTKHTLDTYFSEQLKTGKITFSVINVDEKENEKIAEKFKASGTALIINVIHKGNENHIDLTEFAFMNGNNKEEFSKELKTKIETQLNSI
jgi:PBP1b-binding outer membrane lipoprotein LpoB